MKLLNIKIEKPAEINFILAQSHFIKTVEDCYETSAKLVLKMKKKKKKEKNSYEK